MNILVVDDAFTIRKMLQVTLSEGGHRVFEAADGIEALSLLEHEVVRMDGIISDILMPRMDGYRLCLEIRRHPRLSHQADTWT